MPTTRTYTVHHRQPHKFGLIGRIDKLELTLIGGNNFIEYGKYINHIPVMYGFGHQGQWLDNDSIAHADVFGFDSFFVAQSYCDRINPHLTNAIFVVPFRTAQALGDLFNAAYMAHRKELAEQTVIHEQANLDNARLEAAESSRIHVSLPRKVFKKLSR